MDVRETGKRLSNWGRWGKDDERGTANFITEEAVKYASTMVKKGRIIPLGIPFDADGPQTGGGGRFNPIHTMTATGADDAVGAQPFPGGFRYADDIVTMPLQCATQWDALAHVFYDGMMYNGFPSSLVTSGGAAKNSIDKQKAGLSVEECWSTCHAFGTKPGSNLERPFIRGTWTSASRSRVPRYVVGTSCAFEPER